MRRARSSRFPFACAALWTVLVATAMAAGVDGLCRFRALTGLPCPSCGGCRAVHHLLAGEAAAAVACNPLLVLGGALLGAVVVLRAAGVRRRPRPPGRRAAWLLGAAALAANWAWLLLTRA